MRAWGQKRRGGHTYDGEARAVYGEKITVPRALFVDSTHLRGAARCFLFAVLG